MSDLKILPNSLAAPSPFEALLALDQSVLDAIPSAIYVCAADGLVMRYNRRATELWGQSPQPGDTHEQFCNSFTLYRLDDDYLPNAGTLMEAVLRTGEPQRDKLVAIERADGSRVVVRVNIEPLKGPGGVLEGAINCFQDITSQVATAQLESRYAAIVESSDDAIIAKNLDGIITSWNQGAERLFGYSADEMRGKHISIIIPPHLQYEEADILARLGRGERIRHYETIRQRKDGRMVDISLTVSPVTDARGRVVGASKIARDITRRKRNERDLAQRVKEQAALYRFVERLHHVRSSEELHEAALDAIADALGCDRCSILLFDETDRMRFVAWRGLSARYRQAVDGHSPWQRRELHPQPIFIEDIDAAKEPESLKEIVRAEGIAALAFIPVVAQGALIGKFMTYYDEPHTFSDHESELSVTIARQLGFSVERRRVQEARRAAEAELTEKSAQLDMIMETVPAIIWLAHDKEAQRITGSRYAAELLRLPSDANQSLTAPDGEVPKHFRVLRDGRELSPSELPVQRAARGEEVLDEELEVVFDDGTSRWELANARPIRDANGNPAGAVGAALDITERKEAEEHRKLLVDELNHRVKNTLAVVQGVAHQTFRGWNIAPEPRRAFEGRLTALAAAHNLLTRGNWEKAFLHEVAAEAIRGCGPAKNRVVLGGPPILLQPKQAGTIALALHELCTNAVKYGALSNQTGKVAFEWRKSGGAEPRLTLAWRESGGPVVSPPKQRGFGSRMIEEALAKDLEGEVAMDFRPEGLVCTIDAPLPGRARES